jgi:predicted DsbA family dithiol-disulfide isomerase
MAHDIICPWCWIAFHQVRRLEDEFPVEVDWIGYELMPENLEWGAPGPDEPVDPRRAPTPSRIQLAYAAQGMAPPTVIRPRQMRSHNVLQALEHAKTTGEFRPLNARFYEALWLEGQEVNSIDVLCSLAEGIVEDIPSLRTKVTERAYSSLIVPFDDDAYAAGIFNVPTYILGEKKLAEQPYSVIARDVEAWLANG